ncbi:MAG: acetoacetate decarboxylase family protein [Synergistaceae bacterium]|nr:acetoacetate decarboxylase family protein [Synergistaceae bacterium]
MKGKFRLQDDLVYKMPVHFGGEPFYPVRTVYGDMTSVSVSFETDEEVLSKLIPEDFDIISPTVNVQFAECRDVDWMSGGEYRLIQAGVPVRYVKNSDVLDGEYVLVIWENKACPIIGGREEDGMPKIYADISSLRHYGDHWFSAASYECNTFLKIDLNRERELEEEELKLLNEHSKINYFAWRYIPQLGKGGAALSHATLYPQEVTFEKAWMGEGKIEWQKFGLEMNMLQFKIINSMSELPVHKYSKALMMKGAVRLNVGDSRSLG